MLIASSAAITAGDGCVSVDAHEVTCALGIHDHLGVTLDDLDDSLTLEGDGLGWEVRGGDGADTLVDSCPTGCGSLSGGRGDDTLQGRVISGGAGDDTLTGSPKGDSIGGGPGNDTLSGERRDRDTERTLKAAGWTVIRTWEHEEPWQAAERISEIVRDRIS